MIKRFNEQYVEKRSNKFIHYLNQESIETSAVKSKLSIEEVNQWVEKGRKTREEPFKSFCLKYTKALMDKYLRLLRKTDIENAFVNSQIKRDDLDSWIRKGQRQYDDSNDMFITFYSKLTKILLNKYVEARKNGKRKKEAAKEIDKTVESVKSVKHNHEYAIFQGHTYSRTKEHLDEFADCLANFENVIIAPIYAARETNTFNVSESMLVDKIKMKNKNVIYLDTYDKIKEYIKNNVHEKDLVISIGAGDANKIVKELVSN